MKIPLLITAAALVLIAVKWAFLHGRRLPRHRVRHLRIRLRLRLHPGKGHATIAELWWRWGRLAMSRSSRRTRPALTWRLLAPAREKSVLAGRSHYRHALRLPLDEHAVIFSPPRGGKTGWLARVILHYPGPVLSTTTKHDVFELTAAVRARNGPIHVFNPQGIGAVASTFRWNPLNGCQEPAAAIRRADAFAYRSLAFLADPALAASVLPEDGESLDIPSFLRETGTLYLIAETRGEDAPVAPLFACLASEIHYTAALAGSLLPGGRLDPPLLMTLDEVTQICPVPVPSWLADSGGKGIQIITVGHGEAQLRGRWAQRGPDHHGHLRRQDLATRHLRHRHPRRRFRPLRQHGHERNPHHLRAPPRPERPLCAPPDHDP